MRIITAVFSVFLSLGAARAEVPRVVTDIAPVQGLVARVMGEIGTPDLLIPPSASPHSYAMRPSEARALSRANLVIWVGPGLTPWLQDPLDTLAPQARQLILMEAEGMALLPFRTGARFDHAAHAGEEADGHGHKNHDDHDDHGHAGDAHHGHDDHAHDDHQGHDAHEEQVHDAHDDAAQGGDGHHHEGDFDPHIWLDPQNAIAILNATAEALSALDPENAATYRANAAAGADEIAALEAEAARALDPLRDMPFVVFHDAFHYFESRFGLKALAAISLADGGASSAGHLDGVRAAIAETGAACVISEPLTGSGLIDAVTGPGDIRIEILSPMGPDPAAAGWLYAAHLAEMTEGFLRCLSKP